MTGDSTGSICLNDKVINAKTTSENINLNLGRNDVFEQSDLSVNSGTLGFVNGIAQEQVMQSLNINGHINLAVDVDLQNKKMDTLPDNVVLSNDAWISVNRLNLLSDASNELTGIKFASDSYKSKVDYNGANPLAYSPIYKYEVSYNPDDGFFSFLKGGANSGNPSDNFNPSVLTAPVAQLAGLYTTQLQTFNYAFQHADNYMNVPHYERNAAKNINKYALSSSLVGDVGVFSPIFSKTYEKGFWVKPYVSFESVPLNNGPKVNNVNYGTLIGYDSELTPIAKGFERVLTGYVGYNGASQRFSGIDSFQNGGLLGGTVTLYKGNFFNATTLSGGASAGSNSTMYGNENFTMLFSGIGNKTGYNIEFFDGKLIFQPSFLMSYTFLNTFDYTNAAGVSIKSDPLNVIQLAPGVKIIANTDNGWQPYLAVSMIWNLLDESRVTADNIRLPEMSIDPYVQYGVGLQKRVKDNFVAYGQAMIQNGGRNGISLSCGLKWLVGKVER